MPRMTPRPSRAVAAVAKLPQARQDALADLMLEAVGVFEAQQRRSALSDGEATSDAERFDFDAFLAEKRAALR